MFVPPDGVFLVIRDEDGEAAACWRGRASTRRAES